MWQPMQTKETGTLIHLNSKQTNRIHSSHYFAFDWAHSKGMDRLALSLHFKHKAFLSPSIVYKLFNDIKL